MKWWLVIPLKFGDQRLCSSNVNFLLFTNMEIYQKEKMSETLQSYTHPSTHTHTHTHTRTHTHTHTHTHMHMHTHMHNFLLEIYQKEKMSETEGYSNYISQTQIRAKKRMQTKQHVLVCIYTHASTHTHTHPHTNAHASASQCPKATAI